MKGLTLAALYEGKFRQLVRDATKYFHKEFGVRRVWME